MSPIQTLLAEHIDIWTAADTEKKSGRGRSSGNAASVYGIKKLRELILELAVRGKLVPQDANDEPASELLKRIQAEKAKLIAEGKIKSPRTPLLQRGELTSPPPATSTSAPPFEKEDDFAKPTTPPFVKGGLGGISEEEQPFELPQGWEWTKLGDITNFGATEKLDLISGDTWVLDLEDIEKDTSKLLQKFRFSERRSLSSKNSFQAGDVLYGKLRPYLNKVIVADEAGVCTTEILPIRCYGPFCSDYFKFALKSPYFINYVNARSYGMKMPRLGTEDGRKACFPLPPLAEQHRIVAKVDELMALCDQLETQHSNAAEAHEKLVSHLLGTVTLSQSAEDFSVNWQRIAAHFDTLFTTEASIDALKQTLLQLAVMGKLVPQDPNDEPVSELLKRIQDEKAKLIVEGKIKKDKPLPPITKEEKLFDLPQGWEWVRLGDISSNVQYGYTDSANHQLRDVLFLRITDIQDDAVNWDSVPGCDISLSNADGYALDNNDIVIARTGGTIGKSYLVTDLNQKAVFASYLIRIGNLSSTSAQYKKVFLGSGLYWEQLIASSMGTGQPNVNGTALKNLTFSLPPLAEQHCIVAKVDELMVLCDQLKSRITEANQLQQKLADVVVEQAISQ